MNCYVLYVEVEKVRLGSGYLRFDGAERCRGLEPTEPRPRTRVNRPLLVVVEISCFNKNGVNIWSQQHQIMGGTYYQVPIWSFQREMAAPIKFDNTRGFGQGMHGGTFFFLFYLCEGCCSSPGCTRSVFGLDCPKAMYMHARVQLHNMNAQYSTKCTLCTSYF